VDTVSGDVLRGMDTATHVFSGKSGRRNAMCASALRYRDDNDDDKMLTCILQRTPRTIAYRVDFATSHVN